MPRATARRRSKTTPAAPPRPSAGEQLAAARREVRQLRELRATMNWIRRKRLDADADGLNLARVLCAGTEYAVASELHLRELEHRVRELQDVANAREREVVEMKRRLNPDAC